MHDDLGVPLDEQWFSDDDHWCDIQWHTILDRHEEMWMKRVILPMSDIDEMRRQIRAGTWDPPSTMKHQIMAHRLPHEYPVVVGFDPGDEGEAALMRWFGADLVSLAEVK